MATPGELFDSVAQLYHEARPGYPQALISNLLEYSGVGKNKRILDFGCVTGQISRLLATSGASVLGIDPGANLIGVASREAKGVPNLSFIESTFEAFDGNGQKYDLIVSAQSWHWFDKEIRYTKVLDLLRDEGVLAIITNTWPGIDSDFKKSLSNIYAEVLPIPESTTQTGSKPVSQGLMMQFLTEIKNTPGFSEPSIQNFSNPVEYSSEGYIQLMRTYSDHVTLNEVVRSRLEDRVSNDIKGRGNKVKVEYISALLTARKEGL